MACKGHGNDLNTRKDKQEMKKNKKLLIGIGVVILLGIATIGIFIQDVFREDRFGKPVKNITIGLLLAQTGFGSDFGQSEKTIIPLLKEIYGENVRFVLEDSKSDAAKGVLAARKMLDIDNVDMIYCDLTSVASAISPLMKKSRKVLMAAVYLDSLIKDNPFAIRNIPNAEDESRLLLKFFGMRHKSGKILLIGSDDEFGRGAVSATKSLLAEFGLVFAGMDFIPEDLSLVSSLAEKIIQSSSDGVYVGSLSPSMGILVKELRGRGYTGDIITTDAFAYDYIFNLAGEAAKSVVYVDFPRTDAFQEVIQKVEGGNVTPAAILMYDGIRMYLDKIVAEYSINSDVKINELTCQINGIFGDTRLIHQEMKYPLVIVNAENNEILYKGQK